MVVVPLLVLLLLGLVRPASAATVNAASCSQADITSAIAAAAVGDTVQLPTCTQVGWTGTLTITKKILLRGNGVANTIIQRSAVASSENSPMFQVNGVTGFEMTNFTIDGTRDTHESVYIDVALRLNDAVDFNIHHMNFTDLAIAIQLNGNPLVQRGLIHNNTMIDIWWSVSGGGARGYGVAVYGNDTYPTLALGTAQNVFIEDNTFTRNRHAVASNKGARYVFRHNTIIDNREDAQAIDAHGRFSYPTGTRQYEIHDNTVTNSVPRFAGIYIGGGDGVIFNNSFSSNLTREIILDNANHCASGTYPLPDQIRVLHLWNNVLNEGGAALIDVDTGCDNFIVAGTDYFLTPRPGYGTGYTYPHPLQGGISPAPDVTTSLRMHLKFDEGTLTTAQDSTVNNHDGTLGTGATWGAGKLGAASVSLDGTTDGTVTVTGELSAPTAVTLAAWVWPSAFPTSTGEVLTIGNQVGLRVSAASILGFYWNGTAYVNLSASHAISTTQWTHLAFVATAGAQALYVNGAPLATGSSGTAISYVGQGTDTYLGRNGVTAGNQRYQGLIDDARVYTRALSANDIDGLADLLDPPPLSILITTPTNSASYSTTSALLANLGGIATDETGVTGISWNCPTCTTTAGPATCTPACGASATSVNWNIPSITFPAAGTHLITVTATDASGSRPDTLAVTYTEPPAAGACTHYASQAGGGNGLSVGSPWTVVQFLAVASAGQTLCLLDGTYTGGNSMIVPAAGRSGTASLPITVRALNDGMALLDGQNARNPVVLGGTNQWWVIQGLNAKNGLTSVYEFLGSNNRGTRLIGWNATTGQANATVFTVTGTNTIVEDCAGWGDNARIIALGSGTTVSTGSGFRRCWFEFNDHPEGGTTTAGASVKPGTGQVYENIIGTWNKTGQ